MKKLKKWIVYRLYQFYRKQYYLEKAKVKRKNRIIKRMKGV